MEDKNNIDPRKIPNLPRELQWDSMESKIVDKMDKLEKDERRRRFFFLLFFFGIISLASWMLWPEPNSSAALSDASATTQELPETLDTNEEVPALKDSYQPGEGTEENTEPQTSSTAMNSDTRTFAHSDLKENKDDHSEISNTKNTQIQLSKDATTEEPIATKASSSTIFTDRNTSSPTHSSEANTLDNAPVKVNALTVGSDASSSSAILLSNKPTIRGSLPADAIQTIQNESKWLNINTLQSTVNYLPIEKRIVTPPGFTLYANTIKDEAKTLATHQLSIRGGMTIWNNGYGAMQPERAAFERSISSISSQLNYTYTAPTHWTFMTGVQYLRLESEFNFTEQVEDIPVTLFDTIILVQQNAVSGNQNFIRGDVDLLVDGERRVRHYNRTDLIQVPIALGYSWKAGAWSLNVGGGTTLSLNTTHAGKTIIDGTLTEYQGNANDILSTKLAVNGMLYGTVMYRIRPRWGITATTSYQKSLSNWSTEPSISMNPSIINFSFGISYKL